MTQLGESQTLPEPETLDGDRLRQSRLVLDHLLTHGAATRGELSGATGLGRSALSGLAARLVDAGVLAEGEHAGGRSGALTLTAGHHVLVTAWFGLDDAVASVAALDGTELARFVEPLVGVDEPGVIDAVAIVLARATGYAERSGHPIADLAITVDGAVAGRPPVVIESTRLGLEPVDLVGELAARVPAVASSQEAAATDPGAVAAAVAEHAIGGDPDLLFVQGDGEIAAAALSGGLPITGAHGLAAAFAHLSVVSNGVRCACGQRGCLATVASAAHVLEHAGLADVDRTAGRLAAIDELVRRIRAGDDRARWAWLDAANWIGRALQVVVAVLDPGEVVVGGYWAEFIDDLESSFRDNRPTIAGGVLAGLPAFVAAEGGFDAVVDGSRMLARERLLAAPLQLVG